MKKKVLIVDDSSSLRQAVRIALDAAGYDVEEATEGENALAMLDGRRYHLVVSDVNMPRLDGLSMVKAMKQREAYKYTPVVMLTTEAGGDMKERGREAGAKAWIVKPFQPQALVSVATRLVAP